MPSTAHSRHPRSGKQVDILDQLTRILRMLIAGASGRHHRTRKARRHRHRIAAPYGDSYERREAAGDRAWLVKQEVGLWWLGVLVCALLVLIWVGWRIVAQTAAQSLAKSHPEGALSWVADQPTALNQLVERELVKP